jgi:hypothetical protein
MKNTYIHTDEHIRAREDLMTKRNLDDMLALPVHLRAAAYAEAHYAMNCTGLRPSAALYQAIRTVRTHNGRPAVK